MTSAIPMQCSTNWAMWNADKNVNMNAIFAVMNATWAVVKIRPEKIQDRAGFEPMTSAIPMQFSTNWANKPTRSWLLCWFHKNPLSDEWMTVNISKSYMWNADKNVNMNAIFAVMNATWAVVKIRPENNSGLCRIRTHDFCDTGAVLYQLSKQANRELDVILVPYTSFKWWINDCEYVKINFFTSKSCVFARAWGILRSTRRFFCHDIQWRIMCK